LLFVFPLPTSCFLSSQGIVNKKKKKIPSLTVEFSLSL
jgi:hypothetical protein